MSTPSLTPHEETLRLAQSLHALPELSMRTSVLLRYLTEHEAARIVGILDEIQQLGRQGGPPFNVALLALITVLSDENFDYQLRTELYQAAKEQNLSRLLKLFHSPQPPSASGKKADAQHELTLGHRKTLARSSSRERWEKLLREPEAEVVEHFLLNPKITEEDVVRLASRRPLDAEVLRIIFAAPRWICRYAVKRTLVLNPCTPTDLSLRLLAFLREPDRQLVCSSPNLPSVLREAALTTATSLIEPEKEPE